MNINNIISSFADQLATKGKYIHFKKGSILETKDTGDLDTVLNILAGKINNELVLIKNKLRPFMNDIVTHINNRLNSLESFSLESEYDISIIEKPLLIDELFKKNILTVKRAPNLLLNKQSIPLPSDDEEIVEYFKHPSVDIDIYLEPIRNRVKVDGLVNIWEKYLLDVSEYNININNMGMDTILKVDDLLLLYTALNNMVEKRPTTVTGNSESFKSSILGYYNEVCNFLSIVKSNYNLFMETRQLIIKKENKKVYVIEELYKEYLDNGGTPDSVLGFMISESNPGLTEFYYKNLIEKKEEYENNWVNFLKSKSYIEIQNQVNKYLSLYSIILREIYFDLLPNDIKEYLGNDIDAANEVLTNILKNAKKDYILDIGLVARDIVGKCMFPNTNFQRFAEYITEYVKVNPNLTPADGATFASIDFIIDYLLEQVYLGGLEGHTLIHN